MKKWIFLVLLFCQTLAFPQKLTLDNVLKVNLMNSGSIIEGSQVKGYFAFFHTDKVDKKTNEYLLQIFDENLNKIGSRKLIGSRYYFLTEVSFNGTSILMRFIDAEKMELKYTRFKTDATFSNISTRKFENKKEFSEFLRLNNMTSILAGGDSEIAGDKLFAIPGKGFVDFLNYGKSGSKRNPFEFSIRFFDDNRSGTAWTYSSSDQDYGFVVPSFLAANDNYLYYTVSKKKKVTSGHIDFFLGCIDLATGKKVFEKPMKDDKYSMQISNGYALQGSDNVIVFGSYFNKDDKEQKGKSLGLFSMELDPAGNTHSESYASWATEISKFLPASEKGKIEDFGYIYFHEMLPTEDGKIYIIGEQFRKTASAGGMILKALGSKGASMVNITVGDMVFLEFDNSLKINDVKIFPKSVSRVNMPAGSEVASPQMLGILTKVYGGFDYSFTQRHEDGSFTVGYINRDKETGEKKEWIFGTVTRKLDGKYSTGRLSLESEATKTRVFPAKPGYVMIQEYYRKQKRIDNRLEQLGN